MAYSDVQTLGRIGLAMYGTEAWAAPMAQFLGVPLRTMQRISQAEREGRDYPIPAGWFDILRRNLRNRAQQFLNLADEVDQIADGEAVIPKDGIPELLAASQQYVFLERGFPYGSLKADFYSARESDGRLLVDKRFGGSPNVSSSMIDEWVRSGRLKAGIPAPGGSGFIFWPPK
jgi:hypothetical protein